MAEALEKPNLTEKQMKWLTAYLGEANFNATEAARIAEYGEDEKDWASRGCENVRNRKIQEYVQLAYKERGMSPEEVIGRTSDIARASLDDVLRILDETGDAFLDLRKAKRRGKLHTIKGYKRTKYGPQVEMHSALDALEKLAKMHRLYGDNQTDIEVNQINVILGILPPELAEPIRKRLALPVYTGSAEESVRDE